MLIIKELVKQIDEELKDSRKYAEKALKNKHEHKELADVYYMLSNEEMKHVGILHGEVVKIIREYQEKNGDPPAAMKAIWDWKHEEHIEEAHEIEIMQKSFAEK
jgi:hypothetical protein